MLDTLSRGIPYYFVFILLFVIYRIYCRILILQGNAKADNDFFNDKLRYFYRCEKRRKKQLKYAYFILLLFLGFRGYVYTDFVNYKPFFEMLDGFSNLSEVLIIKGWEPGFIVYTALCKILIPNYFVWNVISTFIDLLLLYKILERYSCNHLLSLVVFFVIGSLPLEFNVLRNAKAIFIFLYALRYIEERNIWKYFAVVGVACLFHLSAVLYFPLYFILHKKWSQWILWCIYIGGALIMFLDIGVVSSVVSRISFVEGSRIEYLAGHLDNNVTYSSLFGNIERFITMLIVILLYNRLTDNIIGNRMFVNMYVLLYISFTFCSESIVMVQRFQYMFIASFWILYPILIRYAKRYKDQIVYLFITALMFMKIAIIAVNPHLDYENILTGISDFNTKSNYVEQTFGK